MDIFTFARKVSINWTLKSNCRDAAEAEEKEQLPIDTCNAGPEKGSHLFVVPSEPEIGRASCRERVCLYV